jgi:hypothetical protein
MHSWIRVSVVYIIFGLLVSVLSTPVAATVFEYTIENNLIKKAYLSLLIDYRCLKIFTSYVFVGLLFIVSLMLFVVPSIVMIYHYAESVDIIMIIVILNIMLSLLILMLFTKRCLLFPYIAMNCGESLIDVFRNISHVRTADVFLIWFVNCPLIIFAIILKVLQKHFDSSLFFTFLDYLLSLNFVFMACMTALLLALFYVKKQHNREMLIMRKT